MFLHDCSHDRWRLLSWTADLLRGHHGATATDDGSYRTGINDGPGNAGNLEAQLAIRREQRVRFAGHASYILVQLGVRRQVSDHDHDPLRPVAAVAQHPLVQVGEGVAVTY